MMNKEQYSSLTTKKELIDPTVCFVHKEIDQENTVPLSIVSCRTSVALSFLLASISNTLQRKLIQKPLIWLQNERHLVLTVSLVHLFARQSRKNLG